MRRAAWPTMTLTVVALVGVLVVLLATGSNSANSARFTVSIAPTSQQVTVGGAAQYRIDVVSRAGFTGTVTLSTTAAPDGVTVLLSTRSVELTKHTPTVSVQLTVTTSPSAIDGEIQLSVAGRNGRSVETGTLSLRIDPTGITNAGPPPGPTTGAGEIDFGIAGSASGTLAPGVTLPLALVLSNPNPQPLTVRRLAVQVVSTSSPRCLASNFAITQYSGRYPVLVPPGRRRSLAELGIPTAQWPRITMLNLATNQDPCKGVKVNLRYVGSTIGS